MGTLSQQQLGLGVGLAVRKSFERNKINMSLDVEEVKRICNIYDWDGKGEIDMFYFMDIFYAMGMNLTKKTCVKFGQTDDVEKKFMKFDEVVKLAQQAVKEPEHTGNYHDFVELCKLYDKNENGTMMLAELETFLTLMGDEIPKEDCSKLLDSLAGAEDEDGFFPYTPFLDKLWQVNQISNTQNPIRRLFSRSTSSQTAQNLCHNIYADTHKES